MRLQGLGLGIVFGASLVKLPQILAVWRSRSAEGLSSISYELEEVGLAVMSANGFIMGLPFSAFGEAIFLLLQNTLLLGQIYTFSKAPTSRPIFGMSLLIGWFSAVLSGEPHPRLRPQPCVTRRLNTLFLGQIYTYSRASMSRPVFGMSLLIGWFSAVLSGGPNPLLEP